MTRALSELASELSSGLASARAAPIAVRRAPGDPLSDPGVLRELCARHLVFDAFVDGARRVELHPLVLSAALHRGAVAAAEGVARVVARCAERAFDDPREAARYALPPDALRLARASHAAGDRAALYRVDLLLGADLVWRACEINADCPGGHNEADALPRLVRAHAGCATAGLLDPTRVLDALGERLRALAVTAAGHGLVALVYATGYAEDLQVCAAVQRALRRRGVPAALAAPDALTPDGAGGLALRGAPVRVIYRFFPTEWMSGLPYVGAIADAVAAGRVTTLSSFAHMFTQSKLAFARARVQRASLDARDRAALDAHVPESHDVADVDPARLCDERPAWVLKRALGRVGDEVFVGALDANEPAWRALVGDVVTARARGEAWLAQRFVPQHPVPTPWGPRYVTLGAYVLDGRFVGYYARVTPRSHVSHGALCVPVLVAEAGA